MKHPLEQIFSPFGQENLDAQLGLRGARVSGIERGGGGSGLGQGLVTLVGVSCLMCAPLKAGVRTGMENQAHAQKSHSQTQQTLQQTEILETEVEYLKAELQDALEVRAVEVMLDSESSSGQISNHDIPGAYYMTGGEVISNQHTQGAYLGPQEGGGDSHFGGGPLPYTPCVHPMGGYPLGPPLGPYTPLGATQVAERREVEKAQRTTEKAQRMTEEAQRMTQKAWITSGHARLKTMQGLTLMGLLRTMQGRSLANLKWAMGGYGLDDMWSWIEASSASGQGPSAFLGPDAAGMSEDEVEREVCRHIRDGKTITDWAEWMTEEAKRMTAKAEAMLSNLRKIDKLKKLEAAEKATHAAVKHTLKSVLEKRRQSGASPPLHPPSRGRAELCRGGDGLAQAARA